MKDPGQRDLLRQAVEHAGGSGLLIGEPDERGHTAVSFRLPEQTLTAAEGAANAVVKAGAAGAEWGLTGRDLLGVSAGVGAGRLGCLSSGMAWERTGGPREFAEHDPGVYMDIGWAWTIERSGEQRITVERGVEERTVSVIVAGGWLHADALSHESQRAIETRGASAVDGVLGEDDPPRYLMVSGVGVRAFEND